MLHCTQQFVNCEPSIKNHSMKKFTLLFLFFSLFAFNIEAQQLTHVQGDLLVKISKNASISALERQLGTFQGQRTNLKVVKNVSKPFDIYLLHFDYTTINETDFLAHVWRQDEVQVAQVNHLISERQTIPNDTDFDQQWHWVNDGSLGGIADADVDADLAWDLTTGGQTQTGNHDIVVCVVEGGGANFNHEDLIDNHWTNEAEIPGDGIDNDANGYVDDYNGWNPVQGNDNIPAGGHGTQVSGMIGAVGNNSLGVTGMNWDVKIMQVTFGGTQEALVIEAYTYPYLMRKEYNESGGARGAFVVATNSSWGIDGGDPASAPLWCAFYDTLGAEGILSCGATTNANLDIDVQGDLPTACPSDFMVSVTRTGISDNQGGGFGATQVDFGAPGINVYTTNGNGGYGTTTGTSFSSPLTAGVIALLYSAPCSVIGSTAFSDPGGTALLIKDAIMQGVDLVPSMDGISLTGGRINAMNAVQIIMDNCGPCPQPGGVQFSNIVDTSVDVSWSSGDSTLSTNLRYREVGAMDWIDVVDASNPLMLTDLTSCTTYELQLEDMCADTTSGYTASVLFETEGCCVAPSEVTVTNIDETTADISWTSVFAANSYNLQVTTPSGEFTIEDLTDLTFTLENLPPCEVVGVALQTVCDTGATNFTEMIFFQTAGCGACLDLEYCEATGNTQFEFIENFQIDAYENISGNDDGYGNYTGGTDIELATYGIYDITLTPGFQGNGFGQNFKVWIDFNQDGEFTDADELLYQNPEAVQEAVMGQIIIPADAPTGFTRMRVAMVWGGNNGDIQPEACGDGFTGEAEDYCVTIVEGQPPVCDVPQNLAATNIDFTAATLTWDEAPNATGYNIQFKLVSSTTWTVVEAMTNEITLSDLEMCADYEFQVESICVGATSGYSDIATFMTSCPLPCDDIPTNVDTVVVNDINAFISWNSTANAIAYRVRFKDVDLVDWTEFVTQDTEGELFDLSECIEYEYQVKAVCNADLESEYSDSKFFETDCFVSTNDLPEGVSAVNIFPNPFTDNFQLSIEIEARQDVTLQILNAVGQVILTENKTLLAGENNWTITVQDELSQGVYFVKMTGENGDLVRRVLKN